MQVSTKVRAILRARHKFNKARKYGAGTVRLNDNEVEAVQSSTPQLSKQFFEHFYPWCRARGVQISEGVLNLCGEWCGGVVGWWGGGARRPRGSRHACLDPLRHTIVHIKFLNLCGEWCCGVVVRAASGMVRLALRCICLVVVIFIVIVVRLSFLASCLTAWFVFSSVPSNK